MHVRASLSLSLSLRLCVSLSLALSLSLSLSPCLSQTNSHTCHNGMIPYPFTAAKYVAMSN